jgi:hypothetical protein
LARGTSIKVVTIKPNGEEEDAKASVSLVVNVTEFPLQSEHVKRHCKLENAPVLNILLQLGGAAGA